MVLNRMSRKRIRAERSNATSGSLSIERPKRGLPPEEALKRWSPPELYAAMAEYVDCANRYTATPEGMARHRAYQARRQTLEDTFNSQLRDGILIASGIREGDDARSVIHPSLWDVLQIDFQFDWIDGPARHYEAAEFFDRSALPLNVQEIPEWLRASADKATFEFDPDCRRVTIGERTISLGDLQAKVVQLLREGGTAWQSGKTVLGKAGSRSANMHDLFRRDEHWDLIESDGQGRYRLRS